LTCLDLLALRGFHGGLGPVRTVEEEDDDEDDLERPGGKRLFGYDNP